MSHHEYHDQAQGKGDFVATAVVDALEQRRRLRRRRSGLVGGGTRARTASGVFRQNITARGLDVTHAVIGEQWRSGTALLQVTEPRRHVGS